MTTASRPYYSALDGLRGIAIIFVLVAHCFDFTPLPFELGSYGVDIFFVLSGFLITDILLRSKHQPNFLSNFYIKRALRIFPLFYLILILFFLLAPLLEKLLPQYKYYSNVWPFVWFHLNNFIGFIAPDHPPHRMLAHFWSLSLEEQFYLLWPLIVLWLPLNRKLLIAIYFVIIASIATRFMVWCRLEDSSYFTYVITSIRTDCLGIGCLLAILRFLYPDKFAGKFFRVCSVLLLIHCVAFLLIQFGVLSFPHYSIFRYSSFAAIVGMIMVPCIQTQLSKPFNLISNKLLIFFGKISYSLYVFHIPIIVLGKFYLKPYLADIAKPGNTSVMLFGIIMAIVSIIASTFSYYLFERKFLRLKDKLL